MVDTVVISQAPQTDDPAHIDAMVKKVDDANAAALAGESHVPSKDEAPARPSWLPEKFGSAEDLAKAYAELEARQGSKPAETPVPSEATPTEAAKVLSDKGLDFNSFSDEFASDGALCRAPAAEAVVTVHIAVLISRLYSSVGGGDCLISIIIMIVPRIGRQRVYICDCLIRGAPVVSHMENLVYRCPLCHIGCITGHCIAYLR